MSDSTFTGEQYNRLYPLGIENHFWNHARNRIIASVLRKNSLHHSVILDIGCGKGIVVEHLRNKGMNCIGVELGRPHPVDRAKEHVHTGTDALLLPEEVRSAIDTVLLLDVLEHVNDPQLFIKNILTSFKNVGNILVTLPARQELWTNYDEFNRHVKRYNRCDVRSVFSVFAGSLNVSYFNHVLYPVMWIYAKLYGKRNTIVKAPSVRSIIIHRILSGILQADYQFLPSALAGTSVMALFSADK